MKDRAEDFGIEILRILCCGLVAVFFYAGIVDILSKFIHVDLWVQGISALISFKLLFEMIYKIESLKTLILILLVASGALISQYNYLSHQQNEK